MAGQTQRGPVMHLRSRTRHALRVEWLEDRRLLSANALQTLLHSHLQHSVESDDSLHAKAAAVEIEVTAKHSHGNHNSDNDDSNNDDSGKLNTAKDNKSND